jgi:hypothetical protein
LTIDGRDAQLFGLSCVDQHTFHRARFRTTARLPLQGLLAVSP